jgi:hypothetical protein
MLVTKTVETCWNPTNRQHYEQLGYIYEWRKRFVVPVEHLPENSHAQIDVLCDYCLEEGIETHIPQTWQIYSIRKNESTIKKDCCKNHWFKKCSESNLINYGVPNQFLREEVKDKIKQTNLEKYGCEFYTQTEESKEKHKETCLSKYGYDNASKVPEFIEKIAQTQMDRYGMFYSQTDEYKERFKNTNLNKYGVENPFQLDTVKQRIIEFNRETYGADHPMKVESIKEDRVRKMVITKYRNGTMQTSRQQEYLYLLYGGELNYPVDKCSLDIAFPNEMVYCEYDGSGHALSVQFGDITEEEFERKEMQRKYFIKNLGWKEIRIISTNDYLPSDEILLHMYDIALEYLNSGHSWIKFDIDNDKIINSQFECDYDYGVLRKIKEEDLEKEVS